MVGKIKRTRQKLHHGAVKLENEKTPVPETPVEIQKPFTHFTQSNSSHLNNLTKAFTFPTGVFAGTQISPETLVQTLKTEEPSRESDAPVKSVEEQKGGKKQQSKKDKMKERREKWLNKISAIKLAREQQLSQARRKATPIVGDMRPLADALPELSELLPSVKTSSSRSRKNKTSIKRKPEPTDFSLMKRVQKRKVLEAEMSHFSNAIKSQAFRTNSLALIGEHLRKRLKQEEEQS